MEKAKAVASFVDPTLEGVRFSIVNWPMSVVRVNGASKDDVLQAACRMLDAWRGYSDEGADLLALRRRRWFPYAA